MKRGFKALAVLAAVAMAVAGPNAFAACTQELAGFAIFQCAERAWFEPKPATAGTVTPVFWQLGYGNNTLNTGLGNTGTGNSGSTTFNGNDNGLWVPDLLDARAAIGDSRAPVGGLCLNSNNNWADFGVDGCSDNFRDPTLPGGTGDDGVLNPLYDVYFARSGYPGVASNDWVVDSPMAVLLKESTGHYFAFAVTSTTARLGPTDVRSGDYNFKYIMNGHDNPFFPGTLNIIPWQRVPGDRVIGDASTNLVRNSGYADPNNKLNSNRVLDLGWNAAVVHTDNGNRPSSNATVTGGGMGTADVGPLLRYVVEKQAIVNPADPYGSLSPTGWTAAATVFPPDANTQITVSPDTCVRLHTFFGHDPDPNTTGNTTTNNCRTGRCGDIGYDVAGAPACVGGPLVADGRLDDLVAGRAQGKVRITFATKNELNVRGFSLFAVTKKGTDKIGDLACKECTTGGGASYSFMIETAKLKGARYIEVEVLGTGNKFKVAIR